MITLYNTMAVNLKTGKITKSDPIKVTNEEFDKLVEPIVKVIATGSIK